MAPRTGAGVLVIVVTLVLAGCAQPQLDEAGELTMAPGTKAHLLLVLDVSGSPADLVAAVRDDADLLITIPEQWHGNGSQAAGWLGVQVPAGTAAGDHQVVLDFTDSGSTRGVAVQVTVEDEAAPLGAGTIALLDMTFRMADGLLAGTTNASIDRSPLPRTEDYHAPAAYEPQPVVLTEQGLPAAILRSLANASVGHSLTLELPEYFGAAYQEQALPREESIPRIQERPRSQEIPLDMAKQQGLITADTREGDRLETGGPFPYVVAAMNETMLRAELDLAEGDRVTTEQAWPDATVVSSRTDELVTLRTDPPVEPGEPFTWYPEWPDATEIASINETKIVLRHSPPVGSAYPDPQQPEVQVTVVALEEDTVTISRANPHPYAGQTAFAEVTVVGEQETTEQGDPGTPSG